MAIECWPRFNMLLGYGCVAGNDIKKQSVMEQGVFVAAVIPYKETHSHVCLSWASGEWPTIQIGWSFCDRRYLCLASRGVTKIELAVCRHSSMSGATWIGALMSQCRHVPGPRIAVGCRLADQQLGDLFFSTSSSALDCVSGAVFVSPRTLVDCLFSLLPCTREKMWCPKQADCMNFD